MTLHSDALATLQNWPAPTADQERLRRRYVAHLLAEPTAMTRSCFPDHLTASCLVLSADAGAVLLTLHAKAKQWFQFGGHGEPEDVTLAGAAAREAAEESGLAGLTLDPVPILLDEHAVPFCGSRGTVHHLDVCFIATAPADAVPVVSDESLDVRWWPADALPNPELVERVKLARARVSRHQIS